ncbi:MAG: hypothetical protein K2X87_33600 [Gemmataceae bacterium]|nr:hypothetical protein [Gemmataceae bacterium]
MSSPGDSRFLYVGSIPLGEAESTLDDGCESAVGRRVYVDTHNGHGWSHRGHSLYPGYPAVPPPFQVRVGRFYAFRSNPRRGFLGAVEEPGHPLDGWGFVCCTRYEGQFDLTDRPTNYNLLVCPGETRIEEPTDPSTTGHWPALRPAGDVYSFGSAAIAETPDHLTAREARQRQEQYGDRPPAPRPTAGNRVCGGWVRRAILCACTLFRRR